MQKDEAMNKTIKESVDPSSDGSFVPPPIAATPPRNQQSIVEKQVLQPRVPIKTTKRLRFGICCSAVSLLIFIFVAAGMPFILENTLRSQAKLQAIMSRDTQSIWSKIPGESQTEFVRSFAFFNFSNWQDFYFHGAKPEFRQIQGFKITEEQEDLDIEWLQNDEKIKFNYYLHFNNKNGSRDLNETIHVVNAAPLGFWYQLKHANKSQLFNQAMGILFTNLENIIKDVVLAQGISAAYMPDFNTTYNTMFAPADIDINKAKLMWDDITFGLSNQDNMAPWIIAARKSLFSSDAQKLGAYFGLQTSQLSSVMDHLSNVIKGVTEIAFSNFYCSDGSECSGFKLAARQLSTSGVTNNTPPVKGITQAATLCMKNATCEGGLPQISIFLEKIFKPAHPGPQFENVSFSHKLAEKWFLHSKPVNTREDSLLHAGNLEALFNNGSLYDETGDQTYLNNIRQRFGGLTREQGIVFWAWVNHYIDQFVVKKQFDGNKQKVGMGLVSSDWFYKSYAKTQDNLYNLLLRYKLLNLTALTNCEKLMNDSILNISTKAIDSLCAAYDIQNPDKIQQLIYVCMNKFGQEWNFFKSIGNFIDYQMESLCDSSDINSFGYNLVQAQLYLKVWYGCTTSPNGYCSNYEIACIQWANSTITMKPIPQLPSKYKPTTTAKDWIPDVRAFEYGHFISKYPNKEMQRFTPNQTSYMINWGGLFSLFIMQRILLANDTVTTVPPNLGIQDLESFQNYIRYLVVFVSFDGFVKERSAYELIFGYNDGFLTYLKEDIDPCRGGDPSIPNYIHFNDENITKEEAVRNKIEMYTGKSNTSKIGFFSKLNGVDWVNFNASKWNGNETYYYLKNPWSELDYLEGTDGKQSAPNQFETDELNIYVPNVLRHGKGKWSGDSYQKYGLTIYKGAINDDLYKTQEELPDNKKYYSTFHGTLNLTSLNGFPIFTSKNHFKDSSKNWSDIIDIWDENRTFIYHASKWDDSYIHYEVIIYIIQPYSGATFSAVLYLQSNYFYEKDDLFTQNQTYLLPVFSINRGGNFSEAGANKVFGLLKTGLTLKNVCLWLGIAMTVVTAILLVFFIIRYRRVVNAKPTDENEVLLSMQQHQEEAQEQKLDTQAIDI